MFGLLLRHFSMAAGHNALRGSGPGQQHALGWRYGTSGLSRSVGRLAWVRYSFIALSNLVGGGFPRVFVALPYAADSRDGLKLSLRAIMAQAIRAILLAKAMAAILLDRRANNSTSQASRQVRGVANDHFLLGGSFSDEIADNDEASRDPCTGRE